MDTPLPILKGPSFTRKLVEISRGCEPADADASLTYRRILIPGLIGGEIQFALLGLIGQALRMRGAQVTALSCDALLPACTIRKIDHEVSACTKWCHTNAAEFAPALGLPQRWYSEFITHDEIDELAEQAACVPLDDTLNHCTFRGIAIGHHVMRSLESYYKVGSIDLDDDAISVKATQFIHSAMILTIVGARAIETLNVDKVLINDGRKTDWGVFRTVARSMHVPVDVIGIGIRGLSVRCETDRLGRLAQRMPLWDTWSNQPLTEAQDRELDVYLNRRATVQFEWRGREWHTRALDAQAMRESLGIDSSKNGCVFALFPNVGFDAGTTSSATRAYPTAAEWVCETIRLFEQWPAHHLIIKAHPSEHHRGARDQIVHILQATFEQLPANVHCIGPDAGIAAESIFQLADVVLTYTSTVSVEAAAKGKPVIMVGGGWNSGRGFTIDVATPENYVETLRAVCESGLKLPARTDIARRYAYSLFFRNDVPIEFFSIDNFNISSINIESLNEVRPGRNLSMDAICEGVLNDGPFVNPYVEKVIAPVGVI